MVALSLAAVGIMSLVAGFAKTVEQAGALQGIVAVVLGLLGGSFFQFARRGILADLSLLTPNAWFIRGLGDNVAEGAAAVLPAVGAILLFALVTGSIGCGHAVSEGVAVKALALAGVNLRRFIRERGNLFFVFIFPLAIVLVIGLAFGGGGFAPALGVVAEDAGDLGEQLVSALAEEVEVVHYDSQEVMVDAVERGQVDAGLVVPAGYDADLRSGQPVELLFTSRPDGGQPQLQALVAAAASDQNTVVTAASFAAARDRFGLRSGGSAGTGDGGVAPGHRGDDHHHR